MVQSTDTGPMYRSYRYYVTSDFSETNLNFCARFFLSQVFVRLRVGVNKEANNDKNDLLNDVDEVTFDLQDSLTTSPLDNKLDKVYR